jgi:hypothetical protein
MNPMTRRTLETIAFLASILFVCLALHAWLVSRDERQRLQSTLATQKRLLDAANARESNRDASLADALAQIAALKRTTQTPEQIVRDLPKYISLPQPITLSDASSNSASQSKAFTSPKKSGPASQQGIGRSSQKRTTAGEIPLPVVQDSKSVASLSTDRDSLSDAFHATDLPCNATAGCTAELPPADLKPLYDYVQDCRACQAELAVAKQNAADDAAKIAALTAERDAAITASKDGTFWRRLRRNALWFAIGAAAGSVAGHAAANR